MNNEKKENNEESRNNMKYNNEPKKIRFEEEKLYIKYDEDDYVSKIWILNQYNEKRNYKKHNRSKYLIRLKKNEKLKSIIINCPKIDYEKLKKKHTIEINNLENNKNKNDKKDLKNDKDQKTGIINKKRISQSAKKKHNSCT